MHVVVCIKQVPENLDVRINPETNTMVREGVKSIINPFDTYAIEEGIRVKELHGGKVTVISMGPTQAGESLREAISMGVDEAILISDKAFAGADTLITSYTLSKAFNKLDPFDIIFCGRQAIDGDTAQVGAELAEWLCIPYVTCIRNLDFVGDNEVRVERLIENGSESLELQLPALFTVVKDINTPRLPSRRGKIRAKKYILEQWGLEQLEGEPDDFGLCASPTQVIKVFVPERRKRGEVITADPADQIDFLFEKLTLFFSG